MSGRIVNAVLAYVVKRVAALINKGMQLMAFLRDCY